MPINKNTSHRVIRLFSLLGLLFLMVFTACKETAPADSISQLEECKVKLDQSEWSDAIDACENAGGDEGYHLAAQAYMGKAGVTISQLVQNIINDPSNLAQIIFGFVPTTTDNKTNLGTALGYLMGSKITEKTDIVYIESILVSSVLIFYELKNVFKIDVSDDGLGICDFDATSGPTACGFTLDLSPDVPPLLIFSGLGTAFYTNLCNHVDATHDGVQLAAPQTDYDVTNDYCDIQTGSLIQYHKAAHDAFVPTGAFKDATGDSIFKVMNFYTLFDSGNVGTIPVISIPLCKADVTADVTADDNRIYDCEIFGALTDPASAIF